jgi:hypothetical protein
MTNDKGGNDKGLCADGVELVACGDCAGTGGHVKLVENVADVVLE